MYNIIYYYLVFLLICRTPSNILSVNNTGKQEHRNVASRTNRLWLPRSTLGKWSIIKFNAACAFA